jgi:hypothetical protein
MTDPLHPIAGMKLAEQLAADFRRLGVPSGEVRINHLRSAIHRGSIQIARSWYGLEELAEFAPMESELASLLASAYRVLDPRNRSNYQERIFLACLSERPHPTERRIRHGLTETRPSLWSAISRMASKRDESQQADVGLSPGEAASWRLVGIDPDPEADELSQANAASLYGMLADRPEHARDGKSDKPTVARSTTNKESTLGSLEALAHSPMALIGTDDPGVANPSDSKNRSAASSTLEERREVVQSLRQLSKGKPARKPSPIAKATPRDTTAVPAKQSHSARKPSDPLPSNAARNSSLAPPGPPGPVAPVKAKGAQRAPNSGSIQSRPGDRQPASKSKASLTTPTRTLPKAPPKARKKSPHFAAMQGNSNQPATTLHDQKVTWAQLLLRWLRWPLNRSRSSRDSNVNKWIDGLSDPRGDSSKSV